MRLITQLYKTILAGTLLVLASVAIAQVVTDGEGARFHLTPDGRAVQLTYLATDTTNVAAYAGDYQVPASVSIDGRELPVTGLTPLACVHCDSLTSITLPEGITTLGFGALSDCPQLAQVSLPASLQVMGDWAFYRDASLREAVIPAAVRRVSACAYAFCTSLDSLGLQPTLVAIAPQAFYYCTSLRRMTLPRSVQQIGEYAFAWCTGLEEVWVDDDPLAITPDVFEGIDLAACRLMVPTDKVEAYSQADVWREFQVVDGGFMSSMSIRDVAVDPSSLGFDWQLRGSDLHLQIFGDAPFFVYDLQGRRLSVTGSHSGASVVPLQPGQGYVLRCGRWSHTIML